MEVITDWLAMALSQGLDRFPDIVAGACQTLEERVSRIRGHVKNSYQYRRGEGVIISKPNKWVCTVCTKNETYLHVANKLLNMGS